MAETQDLATVEQNIAFVHRVRRGFDEGRRLDRKIIDRFAHVAGSPKCLYFHVLLYGLWVLGELFQKLRHGNSTNFGAIELVVSLEAIFLALLVLINQRRMNAVERKSSDLHLQMSMLAEHEITRLARVTELIAQKLQVNTEQVENFEQVKQDVKPDEILRRISDHEAKWPTDLTEEFHWNEQKHPLRG